MSAAVLRKRAERIANERARRVQERPELLAHLRKKGDKGEVYNRTAERRCLQTGSGEGVYDKPFFTCLTDRQWGKLFGPTTSRVRPIACGSFACVYPARDPDKVVKLTADPTDVIATRAAQGIPHVVTLYSHGKVRGGHFGDPPGGAVSGGVYDERWAMVLERLKPLRGRESRQVAREWMKCARDQRKKRTGKREKVCCDRYTGGGQLPKSGMTPTRRKRCRRLVAATKFLDEKFRERGIQFTDWHGGNIGRDREGNWKLLDLGYSFYPERGARRAIRTLQGARRR